ncbi:hypothetical protein MTO98_07530 [Mucilaginibacter sp. SMC90]|uniref:hypothetical protein n=1 Tax=Mucilaginibacter sp. SMC90 TaxID=2929803 RepID=UPI001FB2FAD2|nr:hypothetical protein [Mucilaginibacter sp. SMC90]UOE50927.1 hypothetical protein MTO98_07530 [Mucilaginibacter sp. SMC90]
MVPLLNKLGVPLEVQQFFGCRVRFDFGSDAELFDEGFHYVPATSGICRFGLPTARLVILCCSVMEAIAYLTLKRHRYPDLGAVACVAVGSLPSVLQIDEVRSKYGKCKFILLFGDDLTGKAMDIFVACAIIGLAVGLKLKPEHILITCNGRSMVLLHEKLSLHAFQQMFGIRTLCRTDKARGNNTFLLQLLGTAS